MAAAAIASASSSGQKASGTCFARLRACRAPNSDHHRDQRHHEPEAVLVEDEVDHVADRGQLDERAHDRDPDVLLQIGAAPERDRDRDARPGRASRRRRRG